MEDRLSRAREVAGSFHGRATSKTFKLAVTAVFFGAQDYGVTVKTDWLVSE